MTQEELIKELEKKISKAGVWCPNGAYMGLKGDNLKKLVEVFKLYLETVYTPAVEKRVREEVVREIKDIKVEIYTREPDTTPAINKLNKATPKKEREE